MAISGAAFNPNMGYNSSPLVTLLMTFFNARLGWWLPNPLWPELQIPKLRKKAAHRHRKEDPSSVSRLINEDVEEAEKKLKDKFLRKSGPSLALIPLVNEALGNTDDTYKWIELSDGGHFENLGLYEMVMRRCHSIIVVDCDADSDFHFEDLGNALRKIKIDLGVPIKLDRYPTGLPMSPIAKNSKQPTVYCLEGTIRYSEVDQDPDDGEHLEKKGENVLDGKLVYIKPVLSAVNLRMFTPTTPLTRSFRTKVRQTSSSMKRNSRATVISAPGQPRP